MKDPWSVSAHLLRALGLSWMRLSSLYGGGGLFLCYQYWFIDSFLWLGIRWMNASTDLSPEWVIAISRWWFVFGLSRLAAGVIRWVIDRIRTRVITKIQANDVLFLFICTKVAYRIYSPHTKEAVSLQCADTYFPWLYSLKLGRSVHEGIKNNRSWHSSFSWVESWWCPKSNRFSGGLRQIIKLKATYSRTVNWIHQ